MTGEAWHGTEGGYSNHCCRCDECRTVHAEYRHRRRAERRNRPTPATVVHGTVSTYTNWACRCEDCSRATSAASKARHLTAGAPCPQTTAGSLTARGRTEAQRSTTRKSA